MGITRAGLGWSRSTAEALREYRSDAYTDVTPPRLNGWTPLIPRQPGSDRGEDLSDPTGPTLYSLFAKLGLRLEGLLSMFSHRLFQTNRTDRHLRSLQIR